MTLLYQKRSGRIRRYGWDCGAEPLLVQTHKKGRKTQSQVTDTSTRHISYYITFTRTSTDPMQQIILDIAVIYMHVLHEDEILTDIHAR